jgi:hypothetical protein
MLTESGLPFQRVHQLVATSQPRCDLPSGNQGNDQIPTLDFELAGYPYHFWFPATKRLQRRGHFIQDQTQQCSLRNRDCTHGFRRPQHPRRLRRFVGDELVFAVRHQL